MNAVGELVINRTRMLGRVAELERLADVLNFSKARLIDKVTEFQEKHEFNNILGSSNSQPPVAPAELSATCLDEWLRTAGFRLAGERVVSVPRRLFELFTLVRSLAR